MKNADRLRMCREGIARVVDRFREEGEIQGEIEVYEEIFNQGLLGPEKFRELVRPLDIQLWQCQSPEFHSRRRDRRWL